VTAPERQDRSVDSVEWAAVDDREKIVRFPTRSEPVLSRNDGFGQLEPSARACANDADAPKAVVRRARAEPLRNFGLIRCNRRPVRLLVGRWAAMTTLQRKATLVANILDRSFRFTGRSPRAADLARRPAVGFGKDRVEPS